MVCIYNVGNAGAALGQAQMLWLLLTKRIKISIAVIVAVDSRSDLSWEHDRFTSMQTTGKVGPIEKPKKWV